jgi:hypothetical protein
MCRCGRVMRYCKGNWELRGDGGGYVPVCLTTMEPLVGGWVGLVKGGWGKGEGRGSGQETAEASFLSVVACEFDALWFVLDDVDGG